MFPCLTEGIVPGKSLAMADKIVDDVILRLIDVGEVFNRLPPEQVATALEPFLLKLGNSLATDLATRSPVVGLAAPVIGSSAFNATVLSQGRALCIDIVERVQNNALDVFDLRHIVTSGIQADAATLVRLFERCGDRDLRFVVQSGLWLGGLLGVGQSLLYMVWSPWWSLALSGALVGMITDQLALKIIFEPVEPQYFGPFEIQGLFLKRQAEVSSQFADFMDSEILSPRRLWDELLAGPSSDRFWLVVEERITAFFSDREALQPLVGSAQWEWLRRELAARVARELPNEVPRLYEITRRELALRALMSENMQKLTPAEFERVLHPVFEEDELTLILIGTALGGIAGAVQARV